MLSMACFCICSTFISVSSSSTLASLVPLTDPTPPPPQAASVRNKVQIPVSFISSPVPVHCTRLVAFETIRVDSCSFVANDLQMHEPRDRRRLIVQKYDLTRLRKRQPALDVAGIERELAQNLPIR